VDDEESLARVLKYQLEETGLYEVQTERRGTAALEAARQFKPDLILLDVIMPDIDSTEVAAQLHSDPTLQWVPIVFLTAITKREEAADRGGQIGGNPFLAKPVEMDEVVACIERHVLA